MQPMLTRVNAGNTGNHSSRGSKAVIFSVKNKNDALGIWAKKEKGVKIGVAPNLYPLSKAL